MPRTTPTFAASIVVAGKTAIKAILVYRPPVAPSAE